MNRPTRSNVPVTARLLTGLLCGLLALFATACSGAPEPTEFANPRFDFSYLERVAVVPFENLSSDRQAGVRATRLMITELLASGAVDVVEPGEVQAALDRLASRITRPSTEQIVALGESLGVQAVVLGTVTQSDLSRSGAVAVPVVGLDVHMVEAETGATVWAATHVEKGESLGARIFGTTGQPISQTTRRAVRVVLATLIEG